MKAELERKLAAWVEEAEQHGSGAVYAVLQMLHNCYVDGSHNKFAQHCTQFTRLRIEKLEAKSLDDSDDFPAELD